MAGRFRLAAVSRVCLRYVGAVTFCATLLACWPLDAQTVSEQYLLAAANADRAAVGLAAVQPDPALQEAARQHALTMAKYGSIAHQFAGEPDLAGRGSAAGARFSLITENVAEATNSVQIHELWMLSAGHRANVLDAQVDRVGIAVVQAAGQLYAVEDFSRSVEQLDLQQQEALVGEMLLRAGVTLSGPVAAARQTCSMPSGYAGIRKPWFVVRYTASSLDRLPDQLRDRLLTGKYHEAVVGACSSTGSAFSSYRLAVLLFP